VSVVPAGVYGTTHLMDLFGKSVADAEPIPAASANALMATKEIIRFTWYSSGGKFPHDTLFEGVFTGW
jgi:hypothetical protein